MTIDGIDVSSNNSAGQLATIDWRGVSFGVVKASEGDTYKNDRRFDEADAVRKHGAALLVYHWFKPWISVAAQLANFRDAVVGMGDWLAWYLDLEDGSQPASDSEWGVSTSAMLTVCKQQFAPKRGGLYVGQFFHSASLLPLALDNFWWDPDYGHNDGIEHPILNGRKPVIHQYTSVNGLDRNRVHDEVAFHQLLGVDQPARPKHHQGSDRMISVLVSPIDQDHYPVIDIKADDATKLVAYFCEPWTPDPSKVTTAFGVSVYQLADRAVAISPRPEGVLVRYANGDVHLASTKADHRLA